MYISDASLLNANACSLMVYLPQAMICECGISCFLNSTDTEQEQ